jgi:hypothetical protein
VEMRGGMITVAHVDLDPEEATDLRHRGSLEPRAPVA